MIVNFEERFWSHVEKTPTCWNWVGYVRPDGYGSYAFRSSSTLTQMRYPHRLSYTLVKGQIPKGLTIDHLCRNRKCVNPAHLEAVTMRENTMRGETINAKEVKRTHCPRGHPLSGDNLVPANLKEGRRACLTCSREKARARARQRKNGE